MRGKLLAVMAMMVMLGGGTELKAEDGRSGIREIVVLSPADAARFKRSPGFYEASSWGAWASPCAKTSEEVERYLKQLGVLQVKPRTADEKASEDSFWEAANHLLHADFQVYRGQKSAGRWTFERMSAR